MLNLNLSQKLDISAERYELNKRMRKPQRHRLLHGFPLSAAMPYIPDELRGDQSRFTFEPDTCRGLLVGVLPHSFCNPKVKGCGFCTFPHEKFGSLQAANVVRHVIQEIEQRVAIEPSLYKRKVKGLYLGGGTANLTPAEPFRRLCRQLNATFDLTEAEVTLEGVPAYFVRKQPMLIEIMQDEIDARHFRLSMGIQTFDTDMLKRMGRDAFGDVSTVEAVIQAAHARGMTVSGDLMFNLPWQSLDEMRNDVRIAVEAGLDHIGLYHLIAFRGLGTEFSRDEHLLEGLPDNESACGNWEVLRDDLLQHDFPQTTLTNFERDAISRTPRRYQYEELSFHPEQFEMLGFGPSGISFAADREFRSAWKTLNPVTSVEYMKAVQSDGMTAERYFHYALPDLRILYLTRRLSALEIDRDAYRELFASELEVSFEAELQTLMTERFWNTSESQLRPTARGMFYSDSISALLAWRRLIEIRHRRTADDLKRPAVTNDRLLNENAPAHM